jgi:nitrate reductase gamma subunit
MNVIVSFIAVVVLAGLAAVLAGKLDMHMVFGSVIPLIAFAVFLVGMIYRVVQWAKSPVPFRIPTTCGQQKTLPWIKSNPVENPSDNKGVFVRMLLEVLFFRSLMRNTTTTVDGKNERVSYASNYWLWGISLAFHWCFLFILIRHARFFFAEGSPFMGLATGVAAVDGVFQIGAPVLYLTGILMLAAAGFLLLRRLLSPQLRYISLLNDYFPLFLILAIATSGIVLRYFIKTDVIGVKELMMSLVSFRFATIEGLNVWFYIHLFLVSVLFAYFPFSKLVHGAGVLLSPTRNMANNNRVVRHINPWNPDVDIVTYEMYEDMFRDKMKAAGIPVEKE